MAKTALLALNQTTNNWEASYDGKVFLKSRDKGYVVEKIEKQISNKARALGVTRVEEISTGFTVSQTEADHTVSQVSVHFSVHERFTFLADFVDMVATRTIPSTLITGEGGLGKTYTVMQTLERAGLVPFIAPPPVEPEPDGEGMVKNADAVAASLVVPDNAFVVVKGFSTAKGLFRTLYENRNRIVIFDDCDNILKDANATNVLKAALDSYETRMVTWNSEAPFGGSDLPKSFEFTGGVIFISNLSMHRVPQAIRSRALNCDVSMTRPEIVERMRMIVNEGTFMAEIEMSFKLDALSFLEKHATDPSVRALNLRTLIGVVKARTAKPENWERLALYSMVNAI